jgi:hypothetical protein
MTALCYVGDEQALASALALATRTGFDVTRGPASEHDFWLASLDHPQDQLDAVCAAAGAPERIIWLAGKQAVPYDWLAGRSALYRVAAANTIERMRDLELMLHTAKEPATWTPELHFEPGYAWTNYLLRSSDDKRRALADVEHFFANRPNLPAVRCAQLVQITEELVTNALFDAPVDESGTHLFKDLDRRQRVTLDKQTIELSLWADDGRFGVGVTDPFGSLSKDRFTNGLARGFRRGDDQLSPTGGGAGIGLFTVYRASSHLSISITPRRSTRILAILDTPSKRFAAVRGLNAFWTNT